jgi:hypothetical protein
MHGCAEGRTLRRQDPGAGFARDERTLFWRMLSAA